MNNKLVSILIPVYNVEKFLPDCFSSLENQTYDNIEAIFVNDGSTDNCKALIEDFCKKHSWAKLINQENQGLPSARNAGIANSNGEYIYFYDSDDIMHPQVIETYMKIADEYDIISSGFKNVKEKQKYSKLKHKTIKRIKKIEYFGTEDICTQFVSHYKSYFSRTSWNKLYKRSILKKIDNYPNVHDLNVVVGEDNHFLSKYVLHCKKIACIKANFYYYRKRRQSILHSGFNMKYLGLLKCFEPLEHLDKNKYPKTYTSWNIVYCMHCFILMHKLLKTKDDKARLDLHDYLVDFFKKHRKICRHSKKTPQSILIPMMTPFFYMMANTDNCKLKKFKRRLQKKQKNPT